MADLLKDRTGLQQHTKLGNVLKIARDSVRAGRNSEAEQMYRKIIGTDRRCATAHFGLAIILYRTNRRKQSLVHFKTAIALEPHNVGYANRLGQACLYLRELEKAKAVFQHAIDQGAANAITYAGLSAIHLWQENSEIARSVFLEGIKRHPIMSLDRGKGQRTTLLRLRGAENAHSRLTTGPNDSLHTIFKGSTFSTRYLVDAKRFRLINFMVLDDNLLKFADLPGHALIINSITDPDVEPNALTTASRYFKARPDVPFINDPDEVARTSRDENFRRFNGKHGIVFPRTTRLMVDADLVSNMSRKIEDMGFDYPIIVRNTGTHTGQTVMLAEEPAVLAETLRQRIGSEVYLIQFVRSYFREGLYRKMRVFFIDGKIYPKVHHIDKHWNVHGGNRKELMGRYWVGLFWN